MSAFVDLGNRREAIALALVPAFLVVAVYLWLPRAALAREIESARARVTELERGTPRVETQSRELALLETRRERLAELTERSRTTAGAASLPVRDAAALAAARERFTRALARHALVLTEEVEGGAEIDLRLPPELATRFAAGNVRPRVRTVRFSGAYPDVVSALRELSSAEVGAVVLRLQMGRRATASGGLAWTMVVLG